MSEEPTAAYGQPGRVTPLADGLWMIDLGFQNREGVIAAYLIREGDSLALIETGPTTTLPRLVAGIRAAGFEPADLRQILVTHIHLDHSGGAGVLLRQTPEAIVRVHPIGAPHLIDPARLLASATRLYGDRMEALWGEVAPIPAERIEPLEDAMPFAVGGRLLTAIYTPGHASHHVTYWDPETSIAFTGDVGGVRMAGTSYVCPPAPPPELDPEAWAVSVDKMRALRPGRLCLTHGGPFADADGHLAQIGPNLTEMRGLALGELRAGADAARLTAAIHELMAARIGTDDPEILANLEWATPSYLAAAGLTRLLVKRGEIPAPGQ
jgi:glyoxylase-like metal-dependent hydrolase (beta-lactamase superfamily II)